MSLQPSGSAYKFQTLKGDDIIIGDPLDQKFHPKVTLNKWGGECYLKFSFDDAQVMNSSVSLANNTLKWSTPQFDLEFKPGEADARFAEHGGLELRVTLKQKPASNILQFPIETRGLEFLYQPPLTQQEIDDGSVRPDKAVGSYAVYHTSRGGVHSSKADADKYGTGKAFHIYRPRLTDSLGKTAWSEVKVDLVNNALKFIIPQTFLDEAAYPVTLAGTSSVFGYTGAGVSTLNLYSSSSPYDSIRALVDTTYTLGAAGTGVSISLYLESNSALDAVFKCALYLADGTFVMGTGGGIVPAGSSKAQYTVDFTSGPTLSAVQYWLAGWGQRTSPDHDGAKIYYDAGDAGDGLSKLVGYGTWPAPLTGTTAGAHRYSIICTYTPAPVNRTKTFTVNAALLKAVSTALTVNSSLTGNRTKTLTANASLSGTLAKSLTAGASLLKSFSKTLTANSSFIGNLTKLLTVDANLYFHLTKELTANSNLIGTLTKPLTVDASLFRIDAKPFTVNASLLQTLVTPLTVSADLYFHLTKELSLNASLLKNLATPLTANASLLACLNKPFTASANLTRNLQQPFTFDSSLLQNLAAPFTAGGTLLTTLTKTLTVNAHLIQAFPQDFTANAQLLKNQTHPFTVNGDLQITGVTDWEGNLSPGTYTITVPAVHVDGSDAWHFIKWDDESTDLSRIVVLNSQVPHVYTAAYQMWGIAHPFTLNAQLLLQTGRTFTFNASLHATFIKPFTLNSSLAQSKVCSFTVDSSLHGVLTKPLTVNASLQKSEATPFTVNADLQKFVGYSFTFTLNSSLTGSLTTPFTFGSELKLHFTTPLTANATLMSLQTKPLTVAASLQQFSLAKTFTVNALLSQKLTEPFTINSELLARFTKPLTFNSSLLKNQTSPLTVNGLLQQTLTVTLTMNSSLLHPFTKTLTFNASLAGTRLKPFTVDGEIGAPQSRIVITPQVMNPSTVDDRHVIKVSMKDAAAPKTKSEAARINIHATRKKTVQESAEET